MVIVTGANGFIGSAIVWALNEKGIHDIVCVDTVSLAERPELLYKRKYSLFLHTNELSDFLKLESTKNEISWIIHMGACSSTTEMNEKFLWENNTLYTMNLYNWCAENKKKFIYASSAATYGAGENGFSDTTDSEILKPLNPYGFSKVAFDRWLKKQTHAPVKWYGLKFFNVFGPNEYHKGSMSSLVYKSYNLIKDTNEMSLFRSHHPDYRDGEQMRDFVYVKDITRWILELMEKEPKSDIYNMGFGKARTWLDLAKQTFKSMKKDLNIKWVDMPLSIRNQYQYFTEADMNKWFSQKLSEPQWSVEDGVHDYITNYLQKEDSYL